MRAVSRHAHQTCQHSTTPMLVHESSDKIPQFPFSSIIFHSKVPSQYVHGDISEEVPQTQSMLITQPSAEKSIFS
jgi:hypothetical protein